MHGSWRSCGVCEKGCLLKVAITVVVTALDSIHFLSMECGWSTILLPRQRLGRTVGVSFDYDSDFQDDFQVFNEFWSALQAGWMDSVSGCQLYARGCSVANTNSELNTGTVELDI